VRARIASALTGASGAVYVAALDRLPEPMRVVHALDAFRDAVAITPRDARVDQRYVRQAIEALLAVRLVSHADALAQLLDEAPAVPRMKLDRALATEGTDWDGAMVAYLEWHRTTRH
jgi:hypothetical protein